MLNIQAQEKGESNDPKLTDTNLETAMKNVRKREDDQNRTGYSDAPASYSSPDEVLPYNANSRHSFLTLQLPLNHPSTSDQVSSEANQARSSFQGLKQTSCAFVIQYAIPTLAN